jgi:hypothetical protein
MKPLAISLLLIAACSVIGPAMMRPQSPTTSPAAEIPIEHHVDLSDCRKLRASWDTGPWPLVAAAAPRAAPVPSWRFIGGYA